MANENTMHLVISSVGENLYDGAAVSVTLPAAAGEMTVLPEHEPLVTTLKAGKIIVRIPNADDQEFTIDGGVVETSGTRTVVLV